MSALMDPITLQSFVKGNTVAVSKLCTMDVRGQSDNNQLLLTSFDNSISMLDLKVNKCSLVSMFTQFPVSSSQQPGTKNIVWWLDLPKDFIGNVYWCNWQTWCVQTGEAIKIISIAEFIILYFKVQFLLLTKSVQFIQNIGLCSALCICFTKKEVFNLVLNWLCLSLRHYQNFIY